MKTFKQNIYNPSNLDEYKEVDSNIPEELVNLLQNLLDNIKDNFESSIPILTEENGIYFLIIKKEENNLCSNKYRIKIEKYEQN